MKPTTRLDSTRGGSQTFSGPDAKRVEAALKKRVGRAKLTTVADLSQELGIEGRTIRSILSSLDGVAFLLGGGNEGVFVCEYADEGDDMTRRMENLAEAIRRRVARRQALEASLPRRQERFLGF